MQARADRVVRIEHPHLDVPAGWSKHQRCPTGSLGGRLGVHEDNLQPDILKIRIDVWQNYQQPFTAIRMIFEETIAFPYYVPKFQRIKAEFQQYQAPWYTGAVGRKISVDPCHDLSPTKPYSSMNLLA